MKREVIIDKHHYARENEEKSKAYNKTYADANRKCSQQNLQVEDSVLLKQQHRNKSMARYNPEPCRVINVTGSDVTVLTKDGKFVCRNKSFFKKLPHVAHNVDGEDDDEDDVTRSHTTMTTPVDENSNEEEDTQHDDQIVRTNDDPQDTDLRRSNRTRLPIPRYGDPIPSEIISYFS